MDTINLVFKFVSNLKYYLEIDGVMVFPKKHQSKYCIFQIDSPQTLIVTQARTGAYISTDGASGTSLELPSKCKTKLTWQSTLTILFT